MANYLNDKKLQKELFARTEGYSATVKKLYQDALGEIINLVKGTELEDGKSFSFSAYDYASETTPIFRSLYSKVYQVIRGGVEQEWLNSSANNDNLVKAIFGDSSIEDNHFAKLFQRNKEAMNAFFARKTGEEGLSLSQKVWKYTGLYKQELENTLDLAIGEGTPANKLASKITEYLQEPDRFYKRFRVRIGTDADGNAQYGTIWKRRTFDKESGSYKWVNEDPKKYNPGRGVYRSSYKNAQRLARSETNIAYRTADYERWQQLPFITGIEIKLSNNHPVEDICDDLIGIYPKETKFTGFHTACRCSAVAILAKQEEIDQMLKKILSGEDPATVVPQGTVSDAPKGMTEWMRNNKERYDKAKAKGTLSYFFKDNDGLVGKALYGLSPDEKKALAFGDVLKDPVALLKKHSLQEIEQLHSAVSSKLSQMLKGDLTSQKSSLDFEIDWVTKHQKYSTWEAAADAYKKALAEVNRRIELRAFESQINYVESFAKANKSTKVKNLSKQLQEAFTTGDLDNTKALLLEANKAIDKYAATKAKKIGKSVTNIEKYCDAHRTFDAQVFDNKSFLAFQDRGIQEVSAAWNAGSETAKKAISTYTNGSYDRINRSYWRDLKGCSEGKSMGTILDNSVLLEDTVLRRGCTLDEMGNILGRDWMNTARNSSIDDLNKLRGIKGVNEGYISTSFDMDGGFWKEVDLRIYAPKGTNAFYAKPVSGYGDGYGYKWDSKAAGNTFRVGKENETIVHRGYEYRFVKAEKGGKNGSSLTIYVELLTRANRAVK